MSSRIVGAFAAALFLGHALTPALAEDADWAGLYQGIDALSGSVDFLSIVPLGEGKFDVRAKPGIFVLCESRDGWIVADGRLADGKLMRENTQIHCGGGAATTTIPDTVYTRDEATGILTLEAYNDQRKLYYHRISGN